MVRVAFITPFGLAIALLLFYALAMLAGMGTRIEATSDARPNIDFLMLRQESQLEVRKRELPPEPMDIVQAQPKMPQVQQQHVTVNTPQPSINVPNIDAGVNIDITPNLNNLQMPVTELYFDSSPVAISQVPPNYPSRALRKKLEGRVTVEFMITEAGSVKPGSIVVIKSTPKGVFDRAVLKAIQRWRFKTRVVDGKAVPFRARQELEFKLDR